MPRLPQAVRSLRPAASGTSGSYSQSSLPVAASMARTTLSYGAVAYLLLLALIWRILRRSTP